MTDFYPSLAEILQTLFAVSVGVNATQTQVRRILSRKPD